MNTKKYFTLLILLGLSIALYAQSSADTDTKANEIAKKYFDLPQANTSSEELTLVIIDSKNNKRVRSVKSVSRDTKDGTESYIEFLSPADVKGSKFLNIDKTGKDSEQRLYLPALGKVRRIASSDKGSSFMGTDMNYYDLEKKYFEDFSYAFIEEKVINNVAVNVIEATPSKSNKDAPYSKQIYYFRKDTSFPLQIECYDLNKKLLKTIFNLSTQVYDGVIMPVRIVVDNHQDNQKTLLQFQNTVVNKTIPEEVFSIQNLAR